MAHNFVIIITMYHSYKKYPRGLYNVHYSFDKSYRVSQKYSSNSAISLAMVVYEVGLTPVGTHHLHIILCIYLLYPCTNCTCCNDDLKFNCMDKGMPIVMSSEVLIKCEFHKPCCSLGIREAFAKVLHSENIQWTRMPIELGIEDCFWLDSSQKNFFKLINEMAKESSKLFKEHGLKYADSFIGMSIMGKNMTLDKLKHAITKTFKMNSPYICELMVHPGYAAVAEVGGCGEGPDDFALSSEREHEIEVLCSKEWKTFLSENMQPISFRDAADLQHDGIFSV